jgi:hypothetical protein
VGAPTPTGPGGRQPSPVFSPDEQAAAAVPIDDGSLFFVAETAGLHLKGERRRCCLHPNQCNLNERCRLC